MANVWRLIAHHVQACQLPMIQWAIANERIAIGWGAVGNLDQANQAQYATPIAIRQAAAAIALQINDDWLLRPLLGINLWNFRGGAHPFYAQAQGGPHPQRQAMQCGDLVILKTSIGPRDGFQNSVVMRVTGPYEYVDPPQPLPCIAGYGYQHQRKAVRVAGCDPQALWNAAGGPGGVRALHQAIVGNVLVLLEFPVECEGGQIRRVTDG